MSERYDDVRAMEMWEARVDIVFKSIKNDPEFVEMTKMARLMGRHQGWRHHGSCSAFSARNNRAGVINSAKLNRPHLPPGAPKPPAAAGVARAPAARAAPETAVASSPPEITNLAHAPDSAAPAGYNHLAVRPRTASAGVN